MDRRDPDRRGNGMTGLRAAAVAALSTLVAATGAWNALADSASAPGDVSGPLLSASTPGRAVLHADGLTPGAKRSGSLTIVNRGEDSTITLRPFVEDAPGPRGGRLSDELLFEIRSAGTGTKPGRVLWSGRLVDGATVAQLPLPARTACTLRLTVGLPRDADDDLQGASTAFELRWQQQRASLAPTVDSGSQPCVPDA
jgi:hypothetical protein